MAFLLFRAEGIPYRLRPPAGRLGQAPLVLRAMAKLAFSRVSVAFRKASSPHADIMAEPPLETKGNVTPVRGSRSTEPNTFRQV